MLPNAGLRPDGAHSAARRLRPRRGLLRSPAATSIEAPRCRSCRMVRLRRLLQRQDLGAWTRPAAARRCFSPIRRTDNVLRRAAGWEILAITFNNAIFRLQRAP